MITVVHYGAGNIRSVTKAVEATGAEVMVSENPDDIKKADKIVLPGVGAFGKAVEALQARHLVEPLRDFISQGKPFLGICLGLHLLFFSSEENSEAEGLSLLKGKAERFPAGMKVPHLGWNQVKQAGNSPLWKGIPDQAYFYFAHSYIVKPEDQNLTVGTTDYAGSFVSAIARSNCFGIQFHPEKSQKWGLKLLNNFIGL
jgi:glutamine amidotransferase